VGSRVWIGTGEWEPNLVVDETGNITVTYVDYISGREYRYAARWTPASGWSSPVVLADKWVYFADYTSRIFADAAGNVYIFWHMYDNQIGSTPIVLSTYNVATGWSGYSIITSESFWSWDVDMDAHGNATIAVMTGNNNINGTNFVVGQAPGALGSLESLAGNCYGVSVSRDGRGNAFCGVGPGGWQFGCRQVQSVPPSIGWEGESTIDLN